MRAVVARISNHLLLLSMCTFISCSVRPKCLPSSFARTDNFIVPVRTRCFRRCCLTWSEPGHGHDSCHLLCLLDFDGGAPLATFLLISLEALPGRTLEMACRNEVIGNFIVEVNLILLQSCIKQRVVIGKLLAGLAWWQDHAKKVLTDNLSGFYEDGAGDMAQRCRICRITCESAAMHEGETHKPLPDNIWEILPMCSGFHERTRCLMPLKTPVG